MSTQIEVLVTGEETPTVIEIAGVGPQGAKGDQGDVGPVGPGVASGGDPGQILVKASATEFDTEWTSEPQADKIKFDVAAGASLDAPGELAWDDLDQTLAFRTNGVEVDLAQENLVYVRNPAGESTIPKGAVVSVAGAAANRLQVALCSATVGGDGCRTLGVAITDITSPGFGFVSTFGLLRGFNTNTIQGAVSEGSEVFVSATPGVLTTVEPEAPARKVLVGYVVTTGPQGSIFITIRRSRRVQELDDVHAPSPSAGQVIRRNSANTRYENVTLGTAADASTADFDPAGSAAGVQSNLDTHIQDDTNPHQVTKSQVGLGNVPDLDTTDAVAKAHDQNTDTALAEGTADEVTAGEARLAINEIFPRSFGYPPQQVFAWDTFQRSNRDLHGDTLPSGQTYTVVTPSTGATGTGQARIQGLAAERNASASTIDTASALLVPRTTAVSPQSIARYIRMTFALRNVGSRPYGYFLAWQNSDNWLWCGLVPTALTVEHLSILIKSAGTITVVATSGAPIPDGRSEVAPLEISMRADTGGLRVVATYTRSLLNYSAGTNTDAHNLAYTTGTLEGPNVSGATLPDGQLFSWFAARGQL